jgi:hypothetical protein
MEIENQRRIFQCPNLIGFGSRPKQQTLGTLPGMRTRRYTDSDAQHNWAAITAYVAKHWNDAIDPDEPEKRILFDDYVSRLDAIKDFRNDAAHTNPLPREEYIKLFDMICQRAKKLPFGALNTLLLAWRAEEKTG